MPLHFMISKYAIDLREYSKQMGTEISMVKIETRTVKLVCVSIF